MQKKGRRDKVSNIRSTKETRLHSPLRPWLTGAECPPRLLLELAFVVGRGRLADALPEVRRDTTPSSLFCGEEAREADGVLNWESEFCRYLGFFINWNWNLLLLLLLPLSETAVFGGRPRRFPARADMVAGSGWAHLRNYREWPARSPKPVTLPARLETRFRWSVAAAGDTKQNGF